VSNVDRLTVLGSGVLGGQIAFHSAFKGKTVVVHDITDDALAGCHVAHDQYGPIYQAAKQHLPFTTKLATAR